MSPDSPRLCNRFVSQSILNLKKKKLEFNFSGYRSPCHGCLSVQTPVFGLKDAHPFARLGERLLPTLRIGSWRFHSDSLELLCRCLGVFLVQAFNCWVRCALKVQSSCKWLSGLQLRKRRKFRRVKKMMLLATMMNLIVTGDLLKVCARNTYVTNTYRYSFRR